VPISWITLTAHKYMTVPQVATKGPVSHLNWREGLPLLVSPRVVLRELRRTDAAGLWRVATSPGVARYAWPGPPTADGFEAFIKWAWQERASGRYACFAIIPRDQTEPAGVFELRSLQPAFFRGEIGVLVDPALWDNGVFEDGMRLMLEFAFKTAAAHRIEIRSSVDNARGNAAFEKMGIQKEAVLRAAFRHDGTFEDQYLWSVVNGLDRLAATPLLAK
jgi:RimJ/RimL family protein N-acetyltransferase